MAAEGKGKEKDPVNIVHQNAIFCETVHKEQRHQKLYTNFGTNPYKKMHALSGKPNSIHDSGDGEEDSEFLKVYRRSQQLPKEKYPVPQTEAQEIGWDTNPLVATRRDDTRLHHPRNHSEITKFMDAFWKQKEQQSLHGSD
ncbi:PREDICTED: protein FAM183A-like [Amphimedon queenslandica]|uniref:Uncharacterized protein n=1 Tax=Amphimedon queenslandica TaxID=400682 RepID=A0A1X7UB53_AMPQE|nr:PREDICTED: protein FAM183A-like [Amphimedon queenslandica]|eukprot:XP_003388421.1 PREDICTED: protein FAM183A-like [Amphimedon queenslandica]